MKKIQMLVRLALDSQVQEKELTGDSSKQRWSKYSMTLSIAWARKKFSLRILQMLYLRMAINTTM